MIAKRNIEIGLIVLALVCIAMLGRQTVIDRREPAEKATAGGDIPRTGDSVTLNSDSVFGCPNWKTSIS